MRAHLFRASALVALGLVLSASRCSDDDDPVRSTTARVAAIAAQPDDTGEPFPVNDGAFVFNDTRDTTDPRPINR
ncbi:MAG TPA: hypothetical protein VFV11_03320 [Solimonas sp.]|nr:hypothetical protein [Solimonas sp.]